MRNGGCRKTRAMRSTRSTTSAAERAAASSAKSCGLQFRAQAPRAYDVHEQLPARRIRGQTINDQGSHQKGSFKETPGNGSYHEQWEHGTNRRGHGTRSLCAESSRPTTSQYEDRWGRRPATRSSRTSSSAHRQDGGSPLLNTRNHRLQDSTPRWSEAKSGRRREMMGGFYHHRQRSGTNRMGVAGNHE